MFLYCLVLLLTNQYGAMTAMVERHLPTTIVTMLIALKDSTLYAP